MPTIPLFTPDLKKQQEELPKEGLRKPQPIESLKKASPDDEDVPFEFKEDFNNLELQENASEPEFQ